MKTEIKVLLYLKRNGQGKDGLCPLMGRIMVKGTVNSVTQFGCKIKVDPKLWNATSQRCTGKSRMAVTTNREIDRMLPFLPISSFIPRTKRICYQVLARRC